MEVEEIWESRVPDAPGFFRRRVRFIHINLADIRIMRWRGILIWNYAADRRGFQKFIPHWTDSCLQFQRYNGVDHPP